MEIPDYYEFLQISANAEPETIHRVYRFLAARFHPDNPETGDHEKFFLLTQAYAVLSSTERRAEYDGPVAFQNVQDRAGLDGDHVPATRHETLVGNQRQPGGTADSWEDVRDFPEPRRRLHRIELIDFSLRML